MPALSASEILSAFHRPSAAPVASRTAVLGLPKLLENHRQVLLIAPIRIVAIILVSLILRLVLHRLIDRLVRPVGEGDVPRILRPFKERVSTGLLESLSERRTQRAATVGSVLKSAASITIFVIGFLLVLSELRINLLPFVAGTSIVGVALGFGAQNIVKDFLSGMFMLLEDQYGVGDVIDFEKASGTVEAVGLRTTRLRDVNGTVWYVRNGEVVRVGNKSQGYGQVVLDIPLPADADLGRASRAMSEVAQQMREDEAWSDVFLADPELQGVETLDRDVTSGDLLATVRLIAKVRPGEQFRVARELRGRIRARLERLDIPTDHIDKPGASS
jgi:small-conductance mechanosensitive channel